MKKWEPKKKQMKKKKLLTLTFCHEKLRKNDSSYFHLFLGLFKLIFLFCAYFQPNKKINFKIKNRVLSYWSNLAKKRIPSFPSSLFGLEN